MMNDKPAYNYNEDREGFVGNYGKYIGDVQAGDVYDKSVGVVLSTFYGSYTVGERFAKEVRNGADHMNQTPYFEEALNQVKNQMGTQLQTYGRDKPLQEQFDRVLDSISEDVGYAQRVQHAAYKIGSGLESVPPTEIQRLVKEETEMYKNTFVKDREVPQERETPERGTGYIDLSDDFDDDLLDRQR